MVSHTVAWMRERYPACPPPSPFTTYYKQEKLILVTGAGELILSLSSSSAQESESCTYPAQHSRADPVG